MDNPNVELIYTSTPIGEGNLFNFANQKITKEFHYPTFTRPDYTDEMHSSTEALSAIAYAQEILAIYGLDEAGVFPIRFIDMAYDYYIKDSYNEDFVLNNRDKDILLSPSFSDIKDFLSELQCNLDPSYIFSLTFSSNYHSQYYDRC